ncbi:MAG TPA: hypothetical protein VN822_13880 [Candidatus Acidoferrales bacterium]|nr:hypothetical protein [Candidatus Acidoferrales bacterium]
MKLRSLSKIVRTLALALAGALVLLPVCLAQGTNPNKVVDKEQQAEQDQQMKQRTLGEAPAAAPKLDPQEEAAYKAFFTTSAQDADQRIQLGQDFLQKYPASRYDESVYAGLVQAYFVKQDWKDFYANADKALTLNADDVGILATVGWVIPHAYDPDDPDSAKKLDKAESYEKHAIQVLGALPKPEAMTDDQFATAKASQLSQVHSGLGLVYFRRGQYDDSVKELQLATQGPTIPDPTDLFVLGFGLQNLHRYGEAADAYTHCSQMPGGLQDRCKQSADAARKLAAPSK